MSKLQQQARGLFGRRKPEAYANTGGAIAGKMVALRVHFRGRRRHGSTYTGMPTQTSLSRYSAFQLANRKQPCDSVRPTCSGLGVP